MFDNLLKSLAAVYFAEGIMKNGQDRMDKELQEEYEIGLMSTYEQDREYGGHWETKDGRWDGMPVWVEYDGPIKYLIPRYVSTIRKGHTYYITVDFNPDDNAIEEYKAETSTEVDVAIRLSKQRFEEEDEQSKFVIDSEAK